MARAVAVDLGASSGRFAAGQLVNGRIEFEVVHQTPHQPVPWQGHDTWDLPKLLGLCREAVSHAESLSGGATVGICSWGVDHGFLDEHGELAQPVVCYRDSSHEVAFAAVREHHSRLYGLTGTQLIPLNTIYQLVARRTERPELARMRWLTMPELLGLFLCGRGGHEVTQASTTQLMGLDGKWSPEAFEIAGFPIPEEQPAPVGQIVGNAGTVPLVRVAGHDTASAVCGLGPLGPHQAFLNFGTWSLLGTVIDRPLATAEAESANFTNERTADGRIRLLANLPGFYVIGRLHQELGIGKSIPAWLGACDPECPEKVNLYHSDFYNPASMVQTVRDHLGSEPRDERHWAGIALGSLAQTTADQIGVLERLTGRSFAEIRVAGGGANSVQFCGALARKTGKRVVVGPAEATVLGNLALQFLAQGELGSFEEVAETVLRSIDVKTYAP